MNTYTYTYTLRESIVLAGVRAWMSKRTRFNQTHTAHFDCIDLFSPGTHWPQVKLILKPLSWARAPVKKKNSIQRYPFAIQIQLIYALFVGCCHCCRTFLGQLRCIQTNVKMCVCVHIAERSFINSRSIRLWNSQAAFIPTFHVHWIECQRPNPRTQTIRKNRSNNGNRVRRLPFSQYPNACTISFNAVGWSHRCIGMHRTFEQLTEIGRNELIRFDGFPIAASLSIYEIFICSKAQKPTRNACKYCTESERTDEVRLK